MNSITKILAVVLVLGCGASSWFYAEIEEQGICKDVQNIPMLGTAPGSPLITQIPIPLGDNIPLFSTGGGPQGMSVDFRLLSVTFTADGGIQDFNSVDTGSVSILPADPTDPNAPAPQVVLEYIKAPGATVGSKMTIPLKNEVSIVPYMDGGTFIIEAQMTGGLPTTPWYTDIQGCIYMKARMQYLDAVGVHF